MEKDRYILDLDQHPPIRSIPVVIYLVEGDNSIGDYNSQNSNITSGKIGLEKQIEIILRGKVFPNEVEGISENSYHKGMYKHGLTQIFRLNTDYRRK